MNFNAARCNDIVFYTYTRAMLFNYIRALAIQFRQSSRAFLCEEREPGNILR